MCSTAWQDCDAAKRWEPRCLTSMATGPWYRWGVRGAVRWAPRMGGEAVTRMNVNPPMPRNLAGNPDSPQVVVFLTSIIDKIMGITMYYMHYYAI